MEELKPFLKQMNDVYKKWLVTKRAADFSTFKEARSVASKAIRDEKKNWFQGIAEEPEKEHFGGEKSVEVHKGHAAWM